MNYPVLILTGKAGSGKDTAAALFVKEFNGVAIAQADPLKRIVGFLFGYTTEQLWGPSAMRETETRSNAEILGYARARQSSLAVEFIKLAGMGVGSAIFNAYGEWFTRHIAGYSDALTPRYVLQSFGTELVRAIHPTLWLELAQDIAKALLMDGGTYDRTRGIVSGYERPAFVVITDGRFRNEVLATKECGGSAVLIIDPADTSKATHASEIEQNSIPEWWYDAKLINDKSKGVDTLRRIVVDVGNHLGMWRTTTFGHGGR